MRSLKLWESVQLIPRDLIEAREDQAMDFWHEVNKYWVAAGHSEPLVPDPFDRSCEEILTEVYVEIEKAKDKPAYYKYEAGCQLMRDKRGQ